MIYPGAVHIDARQPPGQCEPMKSAIVILLGVSVAACGGGGAQPGPAGNGPSAVGPAPIAPRTVTYATSATGCIGRHNADSEVNYLLGDQPARYLIWHCADHAQHELRRVRVSLLYNFQQQCYVEDTTVVDFAHCSGAAPKPPDPATFSAQIAEFVVTPQRSAQGQPGFSYYAVIENTGSVPAFDVTFRIAIDQGGGGNAGSIEVIEPGGRVTTRRYDVFGNALAGTRFTLDLTIEDAAGRFVVTRRAFADIP